MTKLPENSDATEPAPTAESLLGGWDASTLHKPKKRSLSVAGHPTSISLEEPFWDGLKAAAREKGVSLATLVAAIDSVRGQASLSSAIRLFVYAGKTGDDGPQRER